MTTHRHICEIAFVSRLIHLLVIGGLSCATKEQHEKLAEKALASVMEPIEDLHVNDRACIQRRITRMEKDTIETLKGKMHGRDVILVCYFFIDGLLDRDYLHVPEGSTLREMVDYLLDVLSNDEITTERLDAAKDIATKWLILLQNEGYYK